MPEAGSGAEFPSEGECFYLSHLLCKITAGQLSFPELQIPLALLLAPSLILLTCPANVLTL